MAEESLPDLICSYCGETMRSSAVQPKELGPAVRLFDCEYCGSTERRAAAYGSSSANLRSKK